MFYTISQKNTEDERAQAIRGVFLMAVFMAVFRPGKRGNDSNKSAPTRTDTVGRLTSRSEHAQQRQPRLFSSPFARSPPRTHRRLLFSIPFFCVFFSEQEQLRTLP